MCINFTLPFVNNKITSISDTDLTAQAVVSLKTNLKTRLKTLNTNKILEETDSLPSKDININQNKIRIAINGFGRIGRQFFKVAFNNPNIEFVAINDLGDINNQAYLLKHDTVYGMYENEVSVDDQNLVVNGHKILHYNEMDPSKLPWGDLDIDVVVESTGVFTSYEKAQAHLKAGAKRVVISAPAKDDKTPTATPNVNIKNALSEKISSNASCTTNAATPIAIVLEDKFGIEQALLNTIHGYTATQRTVDSDDAKDYRRGRAAAQNLIPTSSGAAGAMAKAIPSLAGNSDAMAIRVPVVSGSILDFTFISKTDVTVEQVNDALTTASKLPEWSGILGVTNDPLVSSDILKSPYGSLVDLNLTRVKGRLVKVLAWYDNEWGYVNMLLKHVLFVGNSL